MIQTAILVVGFNRPDLIKNLIEILKNIEPRILYFAIDGPRTSVASDESKVLEVQKSIIESNFECEVKTKFSKSNLGSRKNVIEAIDWVFEFEEQIIILEDDIVPENSFFAFCEELLERLKNQKNIFSISGCNLVNFSRVIPHFSYRFSSIPHGWGWATWKQSWQQYDEEIVNKSKPFGIKKIKNHFDCTWTQALGISYKFYLVKKRKVDAWDYQVLFLCIKKNLLNATSNYNLTTNVGFGESATHTNYKPKFILPAVKMNFPLTHPLIERDKRSDSLLVRNAFGVDVKFIANYIIWKVKFVLNLNRWE